MSKIKLPHASGNSMSIGAPATNPASDLELKLPATIGTAGQYLTVDGSGNLVWADPPGITEMDQWRLTTNVTVSASGGFLTSDWERNDTNFSKIGTGMTESSGVFTFPSTGIWQVHFNGVSSDTDANRYSGIEVHLSTNGGGSFVAIHESWQAIPDQSSETVYGSFNANTIIDVTNVTGGSDFQVKFFANGHNEILLNGSTTVLRTNVTFTRLGAT